MHESLRKSLTPLFNPRSVAIVGCAPPDAGEPNSWPLHNLLLHQAPITIYAVTRRRIAVDGVTCYESLARLPEPADLVLILEDDDERLPYRIQQAAAMGGRAVVLFGSGARRTSPQFYEWLGAFASRSLMPIVGPRSNGVCNVLRNIACTSAPFAASSFPPSGDTAIVSHSGALISTIVTRLVASGGGVSYSCSVGSSVDVDVGACLDYLAQDTGTATILVYLESLTNRASFVAGADRAIGAGKNVIVLKAGRSKEAQRSLLGHSGSLVGSFEALRALCERHGIITAHGLEEFVALPALLRRRRVGTRARSGVPRLGLVSGSGGISAMLADRASEEGLDVPVLQPQTVQAIETLGRSDSPNNPVDLTVHDPSRNTKSIRALAADPNIDYVIFGSQYGPPEIQDPIKSSLAELSREGADVLVWSAEGSTAQDEATFRTAGIPVFQSASTLFRCLRSVATAGSTKPVLESGRELERVDEHRRQRALALIAQAPSDSTLPSHLAWKLLSLYGIPVLPEHPAGSVTTAITLARDILGFPVAAKLSTSRVPHRSRLGLVRLGLMDETTVMDAFQALTDSGAKLGLTGATVVIQKMADAGPELILGVMHDPDVGPCVFAGPGGVFAELLGRARVAPAPVGWQEATEMASSLLRPVSPGRASASSDLDTGALATALIRLSILGVELESVLGHLEVNPMIVLPDRVVAVDVLATRVGELYRARRANVTGTD